MKYYIVPNKSDPSQLCVIACLGFAPTEVIMETTKAVYEDQDCVKIVESASGMVAIVDPDLVRIKLRKIELRRTKIKRGWNESSILQRIKTGLFGGRI